MLAAMESLDRNPPIRVGAAPGWLGDLPGSTTAARGAAPGHPRTVTWSARVAPPAAPLWPSNGAPCAPSAFTPRRWGTLRPRFLADRDASCWAGRVGPAIYGMGTRQGLSLCLRLLALIDLLAQSPWALPLMRLARDGAEPDPALWRTAATEPLTPEAHFDQTGFRARLARYTSHRLTGALRMTRTVSLRVLVPGLALLALSGCDSGPLSSSGGPSYSAVGPSGVAAQSRSDLETRDACRERANEMYDKRGRAEIYAPNLR